MRVVCRVLLPISFLTAFLAGAAAQETTQGLEPNLPALQEESSAGGTQNAEFLAPGGDVNVPRLEMIVRDSYLPGVPVLVRVEILRADGSTDRDLILSTASQSIATVTTAGVVSGVGVGTTLLTARSGQDPTQAATLSITVTN